MITVNEKEIEKKIREIELAKDVDELKEPIIWIIRGFKEELKELDWERKYWR